MSLEASFGEEGEGVVDLEVDVPGDARGMKWGMRRFYAAKWHRHWASEDAGDRERGDESGDVLVLHFDGW